MWLINTETLGLDAVAYREECTHAILLHTREDGEVTFQEIQVLNQAGKKPGFSKIEQICYLAHDRSIRYAWVGTCCIRQK